MTTFTIPIAEERLTRLHALAAVAGVSPEEYLRQRVDALLTADEAFQQAAAYVLKKNEELYRRLA